MTASTYGVFTGDAVVRAGDGLGVEGLAAGVGLDIGEDLGVALGLATAGVGLATVGVGAVIEGLGFGNDASTSGSIFTLDKPMNCH